MGNGMCSRKQKRIFQTLLLLTVVFSFLYGAMLYYELQTQLRKAEAVAQKYQQHQESLSAQLQGTLNGTRARGQRPTLPRASARAGKVALESRLASRGPPLTCGDIGGEPCRVAEPPSVRGDDIPVVRVPWAVPFEMGSAGPWTRWALDGQAHTDSCLPALSKGPALSGQASQQPSLPFCQPIPEGHGSWVLI